MVGHWIAWMDTGAGNATKGFRGEVTPRVVLRVVEPAPADGGVLDELLGVGHEVMREARTVGVTNHRQQARIVFLADEIGSSDQPLALALTAEWRNGGIPRLGTIHAAHDAHRTRLPVPPNGWPPGRGRGGGYHGRATLGKPDRNRGPFTREALSLGE